MKILIDIGHPAHVHYFRNFIKIMQDAGHRFLIIAKNRNVTHKLLDNYGIPFVKRKDYPKSLFGKLLNIPLTDLFVLKHSIKFKPDILIGFSGTHIAHAGFLMNRPRIVIDDTEHAKLAHASYKYFASDILTPVCFKKDFGKKHLRFKGYMELFYLHPKYFKPDLSVLSELGVEKKQKMAIVRFVSWRASHDVGNSGIPTEHQYNLVFHLAKYCKVFISSEKELPKELNKFAFPLHPSKMHDALAAADLFIGEGVTMASESAVLGTPAIYVNSLELGYTNEQEEKYNLVFNYRHIEGVLEKALDLLQNSSKKDFMKKRTALLNDNIDPTSFLVWFIENYPESKRKLKENPAFQLVFR